MGRALMTAVAAAAVLLAVPASAGAQNAPYPPPPPTITVENPAVTVTIEGDDWGPGTVVTITRNDADGASAQSTGVEVLGTATVRPDGTFSFAADGLAPGDEVEVSGTAANGAERVDRLAVTGQQTEVVRSQIAATGIAVWQALLMAAGLLVAGGVLTVVARRRASSTA